jgi:hypothetical protein
MDRHLLRRVNCERFVSLLDVNSVEQADLVEPDDVPEVPADEDINVGNRCHRNMKHVVFKSQLASLD